MRWAVRRLVVKRLVMRRLAGWWQKWWISAETALSTDFVNRLRK
jgi:hypothetical protein